ncbi:MAG: protein-L-isoaspartate(D-aspartate) O-methyltransferase [Candidatus Kapabacteria bacterium]|jgi:protein-L-isoaspartate(D-aspartate) O-methyltransferase|nr:protein-L-isoaspartate(D-aspartate) O-methyltransferase [Candidatus Kapabacteria bacterium]
MLSSPSFAKPLFEDRRRALVDHLRGRGITDERVLHAIATVPRELFVPAAMRDKAYEDTALPIDERQTISQPYTVAAMTQALDVVPGQRILEIGTGSGYQAAVLAVLGAVVYSVERHHRLSQQARQTLESVGLGTVHLRVADGTIGWSSEAPFHGIVVTAGAPDVPEVLARQLTIGGRMIIPVGDRNEQQMYCVVRTSDESWRADDLGAFKFVPLIGREGWEDGIR